MARQTPEERRAERLQEAYGDQYEDFDVQQCKDEVARLSKIKMDQVQTKKDLVSAHSGIIKNTQEQIEYLVERIDYLQHENAVQTHLANN